MKKELTEDRKMDFEANTFAIELLMPEADFRYYIKNISNNISDICEKFVVNSIAVRIRANQLGMRVEKHK